MDNILQDIRSAFQRPPAYISIEGHEEVVELSGGATRPASDSGMLRAGSSQPAPRALGAMQVISIHETSGPGSRPPLRTEDRSVLTWSVPMTGGLRVHILNRAGDWVEPVPGKRWRASRPESLARHAFVKFEQDFEPLSVPDASKVARSWNELMERVARLLGVVASDVPSPSPRSAVWIPYLRPSSSMWAGLLSSELKNAEKNALVELMVRLASEVPPRKLSIRVSDDSGLSKQFTVQRQPYTLKEMLKTAQDAPKTVVVVQ
jgi:hypothetical protein